MSDWFSANRTGLRQVNERLIQRRGFGLIGAELYQNVMDTNSTQCVFTISKIPGKPRIMLSVIDNGPGFSNLTDAWTLFAPSEKKNDPTKAGRFNLGEKVVLSFAHNAVIHTTSGTVEFDEGGRHEYPRRKREVGTSFTAELACSAKQYDELIEYMHRIIVRDDLTLIVNEEVISHRETINDWEETLPTEIGDDLRPSRRKTEVRVYEAMGDEVPMLYELGIPIVETGDKWHVSIEQKVPLNTDRDNVTPSFLRTVRVSVLNNMHRQIEEDDTESTWVNEATSSPDCTDDAAETFRVKKYGERSLASDPFNREADSMAQSEGFTVIPTRGLTTGQRDNLKRGGTLLSSSKQFPTAGKGAYSDDPNSPSVDVISEANLTDGMKQVREYANGLSQRLMDRKITVRFVNTGNNFVAAYGGGKLDFNVRRLGRKWFDQGVTVAVDDLIIHEFGHEYESDHCSSKYHEALTMLGAKLKQSALNDVRWFRKFIKS